MKNLKYDNSECVRKIPYEGISWFVLYNKDVETYKQNYMFLSNKWNLENEKKVADISNFIFVKGTDMNIQSIKALEFDSINDYVVGKTENLPNLLEFVPKIHTIQFYANPFLSQTISKQMLKNLGLPLRLSKANYQVLIK